MKMYSLGDGAFTKDEHKKRRYSEKELPDVLAEAVRLNNGFVVQYTTDAHNNVVKTILGWNVRIITYKMACEQFVGNLFYRDIVEKQHTSGNNEVFAWVLGTPNLINLKGFNYSRIKI